VKIPDEGLSICREDYAAELILQIVKQKAGAMMPEGLMRGYIRDAIREMYERGLFVVRAQDEAHLNYVHSVLDEYEHKSDVRYVLTMRALRPEDKAKFASPIPTQAPEAYSYMPSPDADIPTRGNA
jgi:hypothetical protein